jgi:molybdate transport system ATP-binding protein
MRDELDALQRRLRVPMILITHDPEDARVFGEEVLQLREGAMGGDERALPAGLATGVASAVEPETA